MNRAITSLHGSLAFAAVLSVLLAGVASAAPIAEGVRAEMPVVVTGQDVPELAGTPEDSLAAFRWTGSEWVRIPLQVDAVRTTNLCDEVPYFTGDEWPQIPPSADPVVTCLESRIDFSGLLEGNDTLDEDDQIVFLVREAGERRPAGTDPPAGSGPAFYELRLADDGASPAEEGYVYLFARTDVPPAAGYDLSVATSVGRDASDDLPPDCTASDNQTTEIVTDGYCAYWATRWSLDDLAPKASAGSDCSGLGSGSTEPTTDVLDRYKGHEREVGNAVDDDYWGCKSTFADREGGGPTPGEKVGPVRYVRGILGAKSGTTTTLYSSFYPKHVRIESRLRVHTMTGIARIFDWNASTKGAGTIWHSDDAGRSITDPVDGEFTGQGCTSDPGEFDGACVRIDDLRRGGAAAWTLLEPGAARRRLFHFTAPVQDPVAFTRDPAFDDSFKGFGFFYGDHHGAGKAFNESANEDEDAGSLGNAGLRFDVRTPAESCRAICPDVPESVCVDGPSDATSVSCEFGTYYQPFVITESIHLLDPPAPGDDPEALAAELFRIEREPLEITASFSSDECIDGDGDGWGVPNVAACPEGPGEDDCDDDDARRHPGATEACDGKDNDCDDATADGSGEPWWGQLCDGPDADSCSESEWACLGGVSTCTDESGDSPEICGNGVDDDCDGQSDAQGDACTDRADVADLNGSGRVDGWDLVRLGRLFGTTCGDGVYDASADLDEDCMVDGDDLAILAEAFGQDSGANP